LGLQSRQGGHDATEVHRHFTRTEAVRALRAGRQPEELGRELGVSGQGLRNWLKQADLDEGIRKDGLTSEERSELTRLRREVHRLRQEKEVLKKVSMAV